MISSLYKNLFSLMQKDETDVEVPQNKSIIMPKSNVSMGATDTHSIIPMINTSETDIPQSQGRSTSADDDEIEKKANKKTTLLWKFRIGETLIFTVMVAIIMFAPIDFFYKDVLRNHLSNSFSFIKAASAYIVGCLLINHGVYEYEHNSVNRSSYWDSTLLNEIQLYARSNFRGSSKLQSPENEINQNIPE